MKISKALSHVFERPCSTVETNTQMNVALLLLGFHEVDALPIEIGSNTFSRKYVVSSHACLSKLLEADTSEYPKLLVQPCEKASVELASVSASGEIDTLLRTFTSTGFGFACIESGSELRGLVSLRDLLLLYQKSTFKTDLSVKDVASFPILALSKETSLRETLERMFRKKVRRILVSENGKVVSDREIIKHLFSASRLAETSKDSSALIDTKLGHVKGVQPISVGSNIPVTSAALELYSSLGGCLTCDDGIITPWDIVMKPWAKGELDIS
ncbi:MAG: CBS domain-containing protein [Nitrososphaerota archaeon]|nr:CBS domain-containing protein [Nitrososphaerota archaeon]